ncbi:unnamed protein product [Ectocarpus sp. 8 AP-2014]
MFAHATAQVFLGTRLGRSVCRSRGLLARFSHSAAGVGRTASSPAAWGWMVSRGADGSGPGGGSSTRRRCCCSATYIRRVNYSKPLLCPMVGFRQEILMCVG